MLALFAPLMPLRSWAEPFSGARLDQTMVARVVATALDFMAPRTLEPMPIPQMVLYGLRGLTVIDARLIPEWRKDEKKPATIGLLMGNRVLLLRDVPADFDAGAWGETVAALIRAGWDASEAVRRVGTPGIIRVFFDELFNHFDPYSRYATPTEAEADRTRRAGRAGVGISAVPRAGNVVIQDVQAGSSAAQAGIRAGDRLLAVDGQPTQGADIASVAALLAGPEATRVAVTIRGRDNKVRTIDLDRVRLPPETVTASRDGELLVLRITGFSRSTGSRLAQELLRGVGDTAADMPQSNPSTNLALAPPKGVVLDLRGNRGGVLQQAVAAAAMLQGSGVVATTAGRDPEAAHVFRADGRDLARFLPVVVLVDGNTASAAEILAAALADQRRAVVVGSATLGKGLVQTITALPDGGELLVTWSRVLAPLGWPIQGVGLLPQLCTSLGPDSLARNLAALTRGSQPMEAALRRHRIARAPVPPIEALEIRAACPAADALPMGPREPGSDDTDLAAARRLIQTPEAYATALLTVPAAK
jgi:carboxyl-terminal processing protease